MKALVTPSVRIALNTKGGFEKMDFGAYASQTQRDKAFARAYAYCCDAETSAILCGYPANEARAVGTALLHKKSVARQIERCFLEKQRLYDSVRTGLERIALGRSNDAVKLAFLQCEEVSAELIESLDLSLISSVKRDKDGGVDIKLFDRQKALESLIGLEETSSGEAAAQSFLSALSEGDEAEQAL